MWSVFRTVPVYIFIFMTGAAGLIYQVAWQKYLGRLLGSDSIATAIIMAAFLGGLSLGYYLCGRYTTRTQNYFKAYAVLEGIIGAWCLAFPIIFEVVQHLSRQWSFASPLWIILQGFFCSALLLGVPTVAMGGTIPFLTRGLSKNIDEATQVHAWIYGVNTAGAFMGTLIAGFYLIPQHGLPNTVRGTALLNLAACAFFYALSRLPQISPLPLLKNTPPATSEASASRLPARILYIIAFLSGLYVMTLENVLIRFTGFALGSSSYSFSLIVSVFILCIALGSFAVGRVKHHAGQILFINQLAITLSLFLVYLSLDTWPYWAHLIRITFQSNLPGMIGYYIYVFLALFLVFIIPVGFMGATVPLLFHEIKQDLQRVGRHSGFLFSFNTVGNLLGSLTGGILLYYFFNNSGVFLTALLLAAASTCLASWRLPRHYMVASATLCAVALFFLIATPFYNQNNFIKGTFREREPLDYSLALPDTFFHFFNTDNELKYFNDDPVSTVAVIEFPLNQRFGAKPLAIAVNGKNDSATLGDLSTLKLLAHLPALLSEQRQKMLVIGLGTGITAGEMTLYPEAQRIDIAEISPSVAAALPNFDEANHTVRNDPRVHIQIGDAFRTLTRSLEKWDIIASEPSNLWVSGVESLFSREFYRLAREHLNQNGIMAQWAQIYDASPTMLAMIANTMHQEFAYVRAFMVNTGDIMFLASNHDFSANDLIRAESVLSSNAKVSKSLGSISLGSLDSILIKEIWSPSYISENFSSSALQTLDHPRLHYLAAKDFFIGHQVPSNFLYSPISPAYVDDYLLAKKYPDWKHFPLSQDTFQSLLLSARDKDFSPPPILTSLTMKVFLNYPAGHTFTEQEKESFGTDLIPLITGQSSTRDDWRRVNLADASYREKAEELFKHIDTFRNWIDYYPIDGIYNLLREGMSQGVDSAERNWCALHLALTILREKGDQKMAKGIIDQLSRESDGSLLPSGEAEDLLNTVNALMRRSG